MKKLLLGLLMLAGLAASAQDAAVSTYIDAQVRNPAVIGNANARIANSLEAVNTRTRPITASGTDTYTASLPSPVPTSYTNIVVWVIFTNANTGAATLNLNSLGAKAIKKSGSTALAAGNIAAGSLQLLAYDGTNLQLVGGVGGSTSSGLTPTAVKTSNYTAAVNDLIPCDINTTGSFTVTLPTAPADQAVVAVKLVKYGLTNRAVTVATGGSDVFNVSGGSTTIKMSTLFQTLTFQYKSSTAIWYITSTDPGSVGSRLDRYPELSITQLTAAATGFGRQGAKIIQVGNWVYIMGGYNGTHSPVTNSEVYRANISNLASWTQLSDAPWFRRADFGCGVINGKIEVWGEDLYSLTNAHDAWEGTVNSGTGVITWAQTNVLISYSTPRELYGAVVHNNKMFTVGGQLDDEPTKTPYREVWMSSNTGTSWTRISTNIPMIRDTINGRNLIGCVASFNGKIYAGGGGKADGDTLTKIQYDSTIYVSRDEGVTWTKTLKNLQRGVEFPVTAVLDNKLFWLMGAAYRDPSGSAVIQYMDSAENVHQVYQTTISGRLDASGATITLSDGSQAILFGMGRNGSTEDNDLYLIKVTNDSKLVNGDVSRFKQTTIDDTLRTRFVKPLISSGVLSMDDFIYVGPVTPATYTGVGFGTSLPLKKIDFLAANMYVGANAGSGGGNYFESQSRTINHEKFFKLSAPSYSLANDFVDLLGYDSPSSGSRVEVIGGSNGNLATGVFPTKIAFGITGLDPVMELSGGTAPTLKLNGSVSLPIATKTANYTLTATDYRIECTSGTFTITTPNINSIDGRIYVLSNSGAGTITISNLVSQTYNGSATLSLTAGQTYTIVSLSNNWRAFLTSSAVSGGTWGTISGTITDQTDLVSYVAAQIAAASLSDPIGADHGGTGVANNSAATLTRSGNHALTITTTGTTSVTLPTSGTLVNSAVTTLSSLVSVGTITTGTWSGTTITVAKGGTGIGSWGTGSMQYFSGTSGTELNLGTSGTFLKAGASNPAWAFLAEADVITTDITTGNVSTTKHGYAPKAPNDATKYLDGTGAYSTPSTSSVAVSVLTAAAGTNTIDNTQYAQEWQWSTLGNAVGMKLSSTSTAAASNGQKLFSVLLSGANATSTQTTYAGEFKNTHTGTSSTNIALNLEASGGSTNTAILAKGNIEQRGQAASWLGVYNSFTDASNYDRIDIGSSPYWGANSIGRDVVASSSHTGGVLDIFSAGSSGYIRFNIGSQAIGNFIAGSNGHYRPANDNTQDWGEATGNAFRAMYSYTMRLGSSVVPTSTLSITGSLSTGYVAKTANYTLTISDYTVEVTSGTNTQTLPTAVGITGRIYVITNSGSGVVTIGTTSSQTFANVTATPTTLTLTQFQTATVISNGANWLKVAGL